MSHPPRPKSPCTKICFLDPISGYCAGCYRTIEEITGWRSFSPEKLEEVYLELDKRKQELPDLGKLF